MPDSISTAPPGAPSMDLPRSARALARVLQLRGDLAKKLRGAIDRTVLWKLSVGRRLPELSTAVRLHRLTHGRVSVFGWLPEEEEEAAAPDVAALAAPEAELAPR